MTLIIGSTALKHHFPDLGRTPKDLDVYCDRDQDYDGDKFWHPVFYAAFDHNWKRDRFATPDELYTIKVSHTYWEIKNFQQPQNWNKHIFDILFLKSKGAKLIPSLHDLLYKVWEEHHGKKQVNLNMTSDEFFTAGVKRIYDHDSIHDSVAYGDHALYEELLKPDAEVAIDHKKMWDWPHEKLVLLFREEVAATALERLVIPLSYKCSPGLAWTWALRRTITSLTKGKSAQFIVENYEQFMYPCDYVTRHLNNKERLIKL